MPTCLLKRLLKTHDQEANLSFQQVKKNLGRQSEKSRQLGWNWDAQYEAIGEIVREFNKKDPGSFCFRYPVSKSGSSALAPAFRFDLMNCCLRLDEVLECLDQIDCGLAGILDQVQEAALDRH